MPVTFPQYYSPQEEADETPSHLLEFLRRRSSPQRLSVSLMNSHPAAAQFVTKHAAPQLQLPMLQHLQNPENPPLNLVLPSMGLSSAMPSTAAHPEPSEQEDNLGLEDHLKEDDMDIDDDSDSEGDSDLERELDFEAILYRVGLGPEDFLQ
ncbi:hypothetical protein RRF57_002650 [Xylaria bambusicola]|uniref:Uncharacterized protein n=1 Tax=Xylaria bambusicola TaxID=326684 RepID=A0AAN7U7A2_9PEZI